MELSVKNISENTEYIVLCVVAVCSLFQGSYIGNTVSIAKQSVLNIYIFRDMFVSYQVPVNNRLGETKGRQFVNIDYYLGSH